MLFDAPPDVFAGWERVAERGRNARILTDGQRYCCADCGPTGVQAEELADISQHRRADHGVKPPGGGRDAAADDVPDEGVEPDEGGSPEITEAGPGADVEITASDMAPAVVQRRLSLDEVGLLPESVRSMTLGELLAVAEMAGEVDRLHEQVFKLTADLKASRKELRDYKKSVERAVGKLIIGSGTESGK